MYILNCCLITTIFFSTAAAEYFDLSRLAWTLKNQNGSIAIPASGPPSQTHLDLVKAGIITEPLLGINDFTERWVIDDNWTYTADISPFTKTLAASNKSPKVLLVFYGIDTIANISLAGHPIAWVNNQFQQYTYDVSEFIASPRQGNNLTVALESAWHYGLNVTARPDAEIFPTAPGIRTTDNFEYPGVRQWIRKVASDFGWDWGPAFIPSGIYKPAYLVTLSDSGKTDLETSTPPISPRDDPKTSVADTGSVFFEETSIDIYKLGQSFSVAPDQKADWVVNVTLGLRSAASFQTPTLTLAIHELGLTADFHVSPIQSTTNKISWVSALWHIPDRIPQRWYPHNLGTPKLYNLTASLNLSSNGKKSSEVVGFTTTTGFRTIQLVQSPYTQQDIKNRGITPGDQWHFEPGTNIIPFDPFYARTTTDQLRIWGGGTYQPSDAAVAGGVYDFYSICDELGILAWSELIFSDSMYPINDFLLESIEPEVRQNVRRINRHPSNAQWAGGNEIEGIVTDATRSPLANATHYLDEFVTLFQDFLQKIVTSETKSVPYTDCSTTKGVLSLDPYLLRLLNGTAGEIYGNGERYNYDASQAFNYSTYPVTRFMNEFGFHSMPSFYTWEEVLTSPDDFSFNSTVVMSRDHHPPSGSLAFPNPNSPTGQFQMSAAVEMWLPTPSTTDSNQTFTQWCWSTQIFQSMTMVAQVAWYRHGAGQGENNLGALVWQLNDIWQGVSWSSIEYSGRWKVLQYGLAGIFSPVAIYPFWSANNSTLQVLAISDRWETVKGSAQLTWYDWHGTALSSKTHAFSVPSLNNSLIYQASGLDAILPAGRKATDVWMMLNLTAQVEGRTVTNEQFFTPTSLAQATLVDPQIRVTRGRDLTFTLSATRGVAPWTWIDHPAGTMGIFVDVKTGEPSNGFFLVPGLDRTLRFEMNTALSRVLNPDPSSFVVRSIWNNTHA
ncbi:glycoside hydrolase [Infundibulicybe gibba]|nr:glycoside hydrolase [Infundibulicybe gibba]